MTPRRLAAWLLLASLSTGCSAPGEPPPQPGVAAYHDVIRRELSTARSALATMQLTLADANHDRITQTYATTITHQAQADLTRVATDLNQITPPSRYTHANHLLRTIAHRAAHQLAALITHWDTSSRTQELRQLNHQSTAINHLSHELLG
jgi:hypothetical protein